MTALRFLTGVRGEGAGGVGGRGGGGGKGAGGGVE